MRRTLSRDDVFARICVRDPYFALTELCASDDEILAVVRAEQPLGREGGPISAAEAGRHLAILGSCAAAFSRSDDKRNFYLATTATLTRSGDKPMALSSPHLCVRATGWCDGREAGSRAAMTTAEGAPVFELAVGYRVIPPRLFERLFKHARFDLRRAPRPVMGDDDASRRESPYRASLDLEFEEVTAKRSKARLAMVTPAQCAGHFPLYPTMPVAIIMGGLITMAGSILSHRQGNDASFIVNRAEVRADRLIVAGQPVDFEGLYVATVNGADDYLCRAHDAEGDTAGELKLNVHAL